MRVKVGGKAIIASFLKIEGRGRSLGRKTGERGIDKKIGRWSEPRSCSTSQVQEKGKRGGSKRDVRRRAIARGAMEKDECLKGIDGEEVRRNDPVEYFLPAGIRSTS